LEPLLRNELAGIEDRPVGEDGPVALPEDQIVRTWEAAVFSDTGEPCLSRYLNLHLAGIVRISDALDALPCPDLQLDRSLFRLTSHLVRSYTDLLDPDLLLPGVYCRHWLQRNAHRLDKLQQRTGMLPVDPSLKTLLQDHLDQYRHGAGYTRYTLRALQYLQVFGERLEQFVLDKPDPEQQLHELLFELNFNHLGYLSCYRDQTRRALTGLSEEQKLSFLRAELSRLNAKPEQTRYRYHPDWPSVRTMFSRYITEEINLQEQQRAAFPLSGDPSCPEKLSLDLSVAQLAFLIRLFYEEGLFVTANLSLIFRFFARNFSSKKQAHISAGSLSKEFYGLSQISAAIMRDKFTKMISRINRNFFPV
jgi:hypothetical protein